jgi:cytochrome c oxidase assembly protein subunit 15
MSTIKPTWTTEPRDRETPPQLPGSDRPSIALQIFSWFLALFTFFLVLAGGLVTSTGSALAVPDWPLSYGQVFPKMEGGVFFEHGHRMIAATAGFLTILLAIWIWRGTTDRTLRKLGIAAIAIVCVQGLLGGITVLLKLPPLVSIAHATLGQTYFCIIVSIAVLSGGSVAPEDRAVADDVAKIRRLALLTIGFVYLQLIAGATIRHTGKGLHVHLLGAALVLIHAILLTRRILADRERPVELRGPATMLLGLVGVQLLLGFYSWYRGWVWVTTAHVGNGALILATTIIIAIQTYRQLVPSLRTDAR